ncbi:MAG: glycoside hydrolase family 3 C-terminal domain-containing protein, partial [Eggerthellaceae bacterium]|nr:glycoside hydrolase family 3 C-terminal domain-containing protein [Eggerthellaceae bacterium]
MQGFEQEHIDKLRAYLPECMVLLKRNGAFPLAGPCRIAAFGAGVRNTVKGGTGSGEVNSRYFVSIEEGLEAAGFEISNPDWPDRFEGYLKQAKADFKMEIKRKAKAQKVNVIAASMGAVLKQPDYRIELDLEADAALYVVSRLSGEGNDRLPEKGDFELTDSEVRDILALDAAYDKFLLVINAGGPVDLSPVVEVGNILVMSQLGVEGGAALADVLLGKGYPSGKLATTWSAYADYCAIGDFAERDDTCYREGIYVGYRYFDAVGKKPLFPFGFGLGYTDFVVKDLVCEARGSKVCVSADLVNTGDFAGKETLQVYVGCPSGKLVREPKVLAGFAKTHELQVGQAERVSVSFDVRDLAGFDHETASYLLEAGVYVLYVGTSSAHVEPCA